jgi:hypothetical protein
VEYGLQPLIAATDYTVVEGRCIMWIILVLLWLLPVALGIVIAARVLGGLPAVNDHEWRALFRDTKDFKVSIWLGLTFTMLAIAFFFIGVVEGLVLPNIGSYWLVLVPLLTGLAAMLLVILCLRTGARQSPLGHGVRSRGGGSRPRHVLSR